MEKEKLSSVISKVQKLLNLSVSSNANEAATATALANKLIDQYRLSEADLNQELNDNPLMEDSGFLYETGKITRWKSNLASVIVKHYGCAAFNSVIYPNGRKVSRYKLVGRKQDIEIAKYMFNWLLLECLRLSELNAKGNGRVFVSSYCEGFVSGLGTKLKESRKEAGEGFASSAMVKLDSREKESFDFMMANYKLKDAKAQSQRRVDGEAFRKGFDEGKKVNLHNPGNSLGSEKTKYLT